MTSEQDIERAADAALLQGPLDVIGKLKHGPVEDEYWRDGFCAGARWFLIRSKSQPQPATHAAAAQHATELRGAKAIVQDGLRIVERLGAERDRHAAQVAEFRERLTGLRKAPPHFYYDVAMGHVETDFNECFPDPAETATKEQDREAGE